MVGRRPQRSGHPHRRSVRRTHAARSARRQYSAHRRRRGGWSRGRWAWVLRPLEAGLVLRRAASWEERAAGGHASGGGREVGANEIQRRAGVQVLAVDNLLTRPWGVAVGEPA